MRVLNGKEVEQVSGGSWFQDLGNAIGGIIDAGLKLGGINNSTVSDAGGKLGNGIGKIVGGDVIGAVTDIGSAIIDIVRNSLGGAK
jgi:hypothetical protein